MYKNDKNCKAAGIIIYRIRSNKPQILGLVALPRFQKESNGKFDVPKGQRDPGETPTQCAFRECFEEAGLKPKILEAGPFKYRTIWFYLAECDKTPMLKANPETGKKEHLGYEWLDCDYIIDNCLDYLRLPLIWARSIIQK